MGVITVRITDEQHSAVRRAARAAETSMNVFCVMAIMDAVDAVMRKKQRDDEERARVAREGFVSQPPAA